MKKVTILLMIAVLAFGSVAMAADKRASGSRKVYRDTDAVNFERVTKKSTGVALNKTAGTVAADTLQVAKSTYDYAWNSPARTYVSRDADGAIHVAYINQLLLDNSDRQVSYAYIVDGVIEARGNVTGVGDLAYMPTVRPFADGSAAVSVRLRSTSPEGTKDFYIDIAPGFATFSGKDGGAGDGTADAFPQFAMGTDEMLWWMSESLSAVNHGSHSDDEGATWVPSAEDAWDMTGSGHFAGAGVETSADGGAVAYWEQFWGAPNAAGDSIGAVQYYSVSEDGGASWDLVPVAWFGADTSGAWDVFNSDAGTTDSLTDDTGPWIGVDLVIDWAGNVHMLLATLGFSGDQFVSPLLHYSSARGIESANALELTVSADAHSQWFSDAIDSGYNVANGFTFGRHPTLAADADTSVLFAMWNQPTSANGTVADTVDGIWVTDVYGSWSKDGGTTWSTPEAITSTPNTGEGWTTLDPHLERVGGEGTWRWHAVWYDDSTPGISLFGDSDSSNDHWIYATATFETGIITGVEDERIGADRFSLRQNYPNPFNPSTKIEFTLDKRSDVKLTIFNMLGQEVVTLVDEVRDAGSYPVIWDASNVASGVYFYKLSAGDLTRTKKMVLLK